MIKIILIQNMAQTSTVTAAPDVAEWVESEHCVRWCGLDRMSVGMSSDALAEQGSARTICSPSCRNNCPNLIDLFSNIASGEGKTWPCPLIISKLHYSSTTINPKP